MKKIILILTVLLFAVPAWARVDIMCEWTDSNEITVSYAVDYPVGEPNKIRAFALDITLDNDAKITDVNDKVNDYYTIFPGTIVISGGEIDDEGQAVADPNDHPDTQPGLDSNGITIEMAGLWSPPRDDEPNAPPITGVLLKFYFDKSCLITITQNEARGGVVLTDPDVEVDYNAPGVGSVPPFSTWFTQCLSTSAPEYNTWVSLGQPDCWCYCRQCRGDINSIQAGPFHVSALDLALFREAFNKRTLPPDGECADFNHKKTGPFHVQSEDLTIFRHYFNKRAHLVLPCDQADPNNPYNPDVYTGPYNFWCDPTNGCPGECPQ